METIERNNTSLFTFISLISICAGMILDEISTRIALTWFPAQIYELNKITIWLMGDSLWLVVDIIVTFIMWIISLALFTYVANSTDSINTGWIVGGSIPLVYGGCRLLAGIHNIQLILGCLR